MPATVLMPDSTNDQKPRLACALKEGASPPTVTIRSRTSQSPSVAPPMDRLMGSVAVFATTIKPTAATTPGRDA